MPKYIDNKLYNIFLLSDFNNLNISMTHIAEEYGFSSQDIEYIKKFAPYIYWYIFIIEFLKQKKNINDFEFNYYTMSFLRLALLKIKDHNLSYKMIKFFLYQSISNAQDLKLYIENNISKDYVENIYKKISQVKNNIAKKELFIIAGANGSGKSTLAQQIILNKSSQNESIVFVNADDIARELNPKDIESVKIKAGKEALKKVFKTVQQKNSLILETTLSGKFKESKYSLLSMIKMAQKYDYDIKLYYIYIDNPILCKERIKVRVIKGGHNVCDEEVERRYYRSLSNLGKYLKIIKNWIVFSNNSDDLIEVVKSDDGHLEITNKHIYNNIKGFLDNEL